MNRRKYGQYLRSAERIFGATPEEAADMLSLLEGAGFDYRHDRLTDPLWSEISVEARNEVEDKLERARRRRTRERVEKEVARPVRREIRPAVTAYELDPDWPDDEWLDEGVWFELSASYAEKKHVH